MTASMNKRESEFTEAIRISAQLYDLDEQRLKDEFDRSKIRHRRFYVYTSLVVLVLILCGGYWLAHSSNAVTDFFDHHGLTFVGIGMPIVAVAMAFNYIRELAIN